MINVKCVNHANIETNIRCANCDRPICPKCMVYTPVGIKCPTCAKQIGRAASNWPKPIYLLRASGYGLITALAVGLVLGQTIAVARFGALLLALVAAVIIGEAVSYGAGRQRGLVFQVVGALSALLAYFIAGYLTGQPLLTALGFNWPPVWLPNLVRFIFALIGTWLVISRLGE